MKKQGFFQKITSIALVSAVLLAGCAGGGQPAASSAENAPSTAPAAQPEAAQPSGNIRIALVAPMTGDSAQYGQQFKRGIDIFIEEYNAKGGYKGANIELTTFDDKNDAKEAVNIANKIVSDGNYFCVIGPFSSTCAFAMGEVLDEEKILTVSPSVSHPDYVKNFNYTFRVAHINSDEGVFVAKYCAQKLESKKIAAIYTNNDWGLSVNGSFLETAEAQGMDVAVDESFIQGQTKDFSPLISKIKQAEADTVYLMCNYTEAGQILRQMKDMALDIKVFVSVIAYKAETLEIAGDAAEGAVFGTTFTVDNPDPLVQNFRKTVKERYDVEIDNMIVRAYDAMLVTTMALENGGKMDSDSMSAELLKLKDVHGISGTFSFLPDRNITRQFFIAGPDGKGSFKFLEAPVFK